MSEAAAELRSAVAAAAEGSPYRVERTEDGLDLRIDLVDARWHDLLGEVGRRKVVENHVVLDDRRRTMRITDEHFDVRWAAGIASGTQPRLVASVQATRTLGRTWEVSFEKTWGGPPARAAKRPDHRFTTAEAHRLIREPASELGWTEKAGIYERIGRVAAAIGIAVALGVGLLLVMDALAGRF